MPNNRQLAILIWLGIVFLALLVWPTGRKSLRQLGAIEIGLKLFMPFALLVAWVSAEVWVGRGVGLWNSSLASDTVMWLFGTGFVLLVRHENAWKQRHFLRAQSRELARTSALVQGYAELAVFGLVTELLIQPIAFFVGAMLAVSATDPKLKPARSCLERLLSIGGIALLCGVTLKLTTSWAQLDHADLARQIALPAWLTLGVLPYVYAVALYSAYELAFLWTGWRVRDGRRMRAMRKIALVTSLNVRVRDAGRFVHPWPERLQEAMTFREARQVLRDFRDRETPRFVEADDAGGPGA